MMFLFLFSHFPHLHIHYPPVHTFFSFSVKVLITYVLFCFGISGLECWRSYHISFWFHWVFSVFKLHVLPFVLLVSFCWRAGPLCLGRRITVNAAQRPWEQEMHQSLPLGNLCLWTANFIVLVAPATPGGTIWLEGAPDLGWIDLAFSNFLLMGKWYSFAETFLPCWHCGLFPGQSQGLQCSLAVTASYNFQPAMQLLRWQLPNSAPQDQWLWLLHFVISYPLNNKMHEPADL